MANEIISNAQILEAGIFELIGINEQVDQNDYSGAVQVNINWAQRGGIIRSVMLCQTEDGSGSILTDIAGTLLFFDADPSVDSGDTTIAAAAAPTLLGTVAVATTDWVALGGSTVAFFTPNIAFHRLSSVWVVFKHTGATSINSAAGDDEQLECNFWYENLTSP